MCKNTQYFSGNVKHKQLGIDKTQHCGGTEEG